MTTSPPPTSSDGDRFPRRASRLRRAVVGGSVAASLAIAGALGVTAVEQSSSASGSAPSSASGTTSGSTGSGATSTSDNASTSSGLYAGTGAAQATTGGS
jgi:hypothetical protein